jgi:hypothetical protein
MPYTEATLLDLEEAHLRCYFIFDVADSIKLSLLKTVKGNDFVPEPLSFTDVPLPEYIQFSVAPLAAALKAVPTSFGELDCRVKVYEYGTVSIRFSRPFQGTFQEFRSLAMKIRLSKELMTCATQLLEEVLSELKPALSKPHEESQQKDLLEDYYVAEVQRFSTPLTATELMQEHRAAIASLVSLEEKGLSAMQIDEALKEAYSYCEHELAVLTWDQAFIYDDQAGAAAVNSIIEFANTQLVELRTYDRLLDRHLDEIYRVKTERLRTSLFQSFTSGRLTAERQAERLRHLLVDVRELSDRATNAIKIIGCAYYARLYGGISQRLSLAQWQAQVESKLDSVGELYRFANDQAELARSEFLEIIVILLIALEVLIGIFGRH